MPLDPDPTIFMTSQLRIYRFNQALIRRVLTFAMTRLGVEGYDLSVIFVSPPTIRALNRDYRAKDKPTDVLSFAQHEWPEPLVCGIQSANRTRAHRKDYGQTLGDLVVCPQVAFHQAHRMGHSLGREVAFLLIHGLLHLCGHDHEEPKPETQMLKQQRHLMRTLAEEVSAARFSSICRKGKK